jgi:type IV pilus assembly protein PilA
MIERARARVAQARGQDGFTLIEVLVVIVIIAVLLAIAMATFIGFRSRASEARAQYDVRAIIPSIESYYADRGTYATMTLPALQTYDQAVDVSKYTLSSVSDTTYCIQSSWGGQTWRKNGPSEPPEPLACP